MRRGAAALALALVAMNASAASERRIRSINVGAQAVMTLVRGAVQHNVHSLADAGRCLGAGAAGGYGAYEAKILVRNGHVQQGWLLANAAASLSENAAAGKRPWAQLGYTFGPLRLRVAAFDRGADAYSYVDVSAIEAIALVYAKRNNDAMHFRSGLVAFERHTPYPPRNGSGPYAGYTFGIYPGVYTNTAPDVWHHEVIHAIQSLQADAVEPSFARLTLHPAPSAKRRIIRFDHLQLGFVNVANGNMLAQQKYEERWTEIEAYRLAQRREP
jgi:hypothetical protein